VTVEADGSTSETFSRVLDRTQANLWHDERIDLSPWSGRVVRLTLETRADPPRENILWADRVQTAWGDPLLATRFWRRQRHEVSRLAEWLGSEAASVGVDVERQTTISAFAVNLLLAGALSILATAMFRQFPITRDQGPEWTSVLTLLTLVMTFVIAIVHLSGPLSLGLLGALSIIRFRTPIRTGAELLALLVAIALGLTLGAGERLLAVSAVMVVSILVWALSVLGKPAGERRLLLTASGNASEIGANFERLHAILREVGRNAVVQEMNVEAGRVRIRALVTVDGTEQTQRLGACLRQRLPRFDISYRLVDSQVE
jgi:hypothetical protein